MTNNKTTERDWSELAQDALNLWQDQLTAIATDPQTKDEMARLVSPMGEVMTQWTSFLQASLQGMSNTAAAFQETALAPIATDVFTATAPAASTAKASEEPLVSDVFVASSTAKAGTGLDPSYLDSSYYNQTKSHDEKAIEDDLTVLESLLAQARAWRKRELEGTIPSAQEALQKAGLRVAPAAARSGTDTTAIAALQGLDSGSVFVDPVLCLAGLSFSAKQGALEYAVTQTPAAVATAATAATFETFVTEPFIDTALAATAQTDTQQSVRGPSAEGSRDLAELASRLAQLERELDGMRSAASDSDAAAAGDLEQVASATSR
ncbi:MAG: hypothetical protein FWF24_01075 [Alphaproteobacteria bacterium]|nr:hypothetical protein [Alphaproteobacteria bacterium]